MLEAPLIQDITKNLTVLYLKIQTVCPKTKPYLVWFSSLLASAHEVQRGRPYLVLFYFLYFVKPAFSLVFSAQQPLSLSSSFCLYCFLYKKVLLFNETTISGNQIQLNCQLITSPNLPQQIDLKLLEHLSRLVFVNV